MTKTIVITSGKGGVGKTNISVNTALELARRQYRTCLLDADLGLANVNILLGIHPEKNLDDFIFTGIPLEEIIVETAYGIDVIPGSSGVEKMANLDSGQLAGLVKAFSNLAGYDYFLIDTASGISRGVISFCLAATETILVLTSEATSLADAYAVLKVLSLNNYHGTVKILVNKCASVPQAKKTYLHFKTVADKHLNIEMAPGGAVLVDPQIEKAVSQQQPVIALFPDCMASQCIRAMVSNLEQTDPAEEGSGDLGDFWSRYVDLVQSGLLLPGESKQQVTTDQPGPLHEGKELISEAFPEVEQGPPRRPSPHVRPQAQDLSLLRDGLFTTIWLPSPPPLLSFALKMQGCGQLSLAESRKIIACDPALICRTLQAHRLSQMLPSAETKSIEQAVDELGEEAVSRLLLSTATHSLLSGGLDNNFDEINELWAYSYRCGLLTEALAEMIAYPFPEEAFLAGMLHDVGRLALQAHFPEIYAACPFSSAHEEGVLEAERKLAGKTHAELGAEILAEWCPSSLIIDATKYHVESEERVETALDVTKLVALAQRLCNPSEEAAAAAVALAMRFFGLSSAQVLSCTERVEQDVARRAEGYNIPLGVNTSERELEELVSSFRQQAMDHVMLQGALPSSQPAQNMPEKLRCIHQGLNLLFGINRAICLLPDSRQLNLQATGYLHCFGSELLENITYSLDSQKSLVIDAYRLGRLNIVKFDELHTMADRQLVNVLQADGLICLPLVASGTSRGVIVCGFNESEYSHIKTLHNRFEQFGIQAAASVIAL